MMKMKMLTALAAIFALLVLAALTNSYHRGGAASADLLWNQDEAILFINVSDLGWKQSYLQYFGSLIKERFRVGTPYTNVHPHVLILRITNGGIQRYSAEGVSPDFYTPFRNSIYANLGGALVRWDGGQFEQTSAQEQQEFRASKPEGTPLSTEANGWSRQQNILNRNRGETVISIRLNEKTLTILVKHDNDTDVSVDLLRPGVESERIWYLDKRPHRLNGAEYARLFGNH